MRGLRAWFVRLGAALRPGRRDRELAAELNGHLELAIEDNVRAGMTSEQARRRALIDLGGFVPTSERCRDRRGIAVVETLARDIRFGVRLLIRNPTFSAVAIITLAVGIGANTAIFSLINALVIRPLPGVYQPAGLVRLTNDDFSYPTFEELAGRQVFANPVAFRQQRMPAEVDGAMQWTQVALVSGDYYPALGVPAMLGRTLSPEDSRAQAPVAVLTHAFWMRAFGGNPDVIDHTIRLNGLPITIIGVTPSEFAGLVVESPTDVTLPLTLAPQIWTHLGSDVLTRRTARWVKVIGRLAPGQPLKKANARLQVAWPQVLLASAPTEDRYRSGFLADNTTELLPAGNGFSDLRGTYASALYVLMGLVGLVALIASANVANLLLARGAARQKEFAVRLAAGAGRGRVVAQLVTESALIATVAAMTGLLFASWGTHLLVAFISSSQDTSSLDPRLDWRVLLFTIALAALTVLLFGLTPARRAGRVDIGASLKEESRTHSGAGTSLRRGLVIAQVALSMILAVGAGLFINSLRQILAVDAGFDATNVLLVRANATAAGYRGPRTTQLFNDVLTRVNALPDVQAAALSWVPPVSRGTANGGPIGVEGRVPRTGEDRLARVARAALSNFVSPRYFETVNQTLVAGRMFTDQDRQGTPNVAIVNESFARYFFGNQNPVGRRFDPKGGDQFDCEVVGVVRDASYMSLKDEPKRVFYVPYGQGWDFLEGENMTLEVRSATDTAALAREVQRAVAEFDRSILVESETLQSHVNGSLTGERLLALLSGLLGAVSLLLVAIGLHGVLAYSVARRTGEIGIRIALGAQPTSVVSMVLREGLVLVLIGSVIGGLAALACSQLIASLLFGVTARDATAFAGATAAIALAALLATLVPARRATRLNPVVALRYE